jgi:hypothetical protein
MPRVRIGAVAAGVAIGALHLGQTDGVARCSYIAGYPSATGQNTYMLATATSDTVRATVDTPQAFMRQEVPAQLMRIDDVAGYQEAKVQRALRAGDGKAVFIRYVISPSCSPYPARDGAIDSAGTNGLYVGRLRPSAQWVGARPTFDIFKAPHFPLPERFGGPSGHFVATIQDSTPVMTARELFRMYQTLWAESVTADDRAVEQRIQRWITRHPEQARKQPTRQVADGMIWGMTQTKVESSPIPFGGTFAIDVLVSGVDSVRLYGQTHAEARTWIVDVRRDPATQLALGVHIRSYSIDINTAAELENDRPVEAKKCAQIPTIIDELPIATQTDSTWHARMYIEGFLRCAPHASKLSGVTWPQMASSRLPGGATPVSFRLHADGRITFDATISNGADTMIIRGERISTKTFSYMKSDEWGNRR